jgi:hypothetical protein
MQRRGVQGPLLFSMRMLEQRKDRGSGERIHAAENPYRAVGKSKPIRIDADDWGFADEHQ